MTFVRKTPEREETRAYAIRTILVRIIAEIYHERDGSCVSQRPRSGIEAETRGKDPKEPCTRPRLLLLLPAAVSELISAAPMRQSTLRRN